MLDKSLKEIVQRYPSRRYYLAGYPCTIEEVLIQAYGVRKRDASTEKKAKEIKGLNL